MTRGWQAWMTAMATRTCAVRFTPPAKRVVCAPLPRGQGRPLPRPCPRSVRALLGTVTHAYARTADARTHKCSTRARSPTRRCTQRPHTGVQLHPKKTCVAYMRECVCIRLARTCTRAKRADDMTDAHVWVRCYSSRLVVKIMRDKKGAKRLQAALVRACACRARPA